MSCPHFTPEFQISANVTFGQFNSSFRDNLQCKDTYLRPDPGGAFIPWLYALFLLLFHLPACIIRAVRWESAQYLALGLAVLGIALTAQSFQSTSLQAKNILVWMPLTLILDVGAMLQMVVLIIEKHGESLRHAIVAIIAFVLLLTLLFLQIWALAAAVQGRNHKKSLRVKWCSPAFQDFTLAITTGNCNVYGILESSSNGISCIELPAVLQDEWLTGTIICLSGAIVCQAIDMALLRCAHGRRCRGVRMQRPWLTMFGGVILLVLLITLGVFNANRLPEGVTSLVWVYRKEPMAVVGSVCQTRLKSPGLRGMIIGWTDGLFESWSSAYEGSVVRRRGLIAPFY
ncbi:uncharacterized protein BDR25DRAFT_365611 [Lindgomyces ingoldianus]|uniref:Uncharacterized protein n=1 Tax=Lindgomyces ingoldianus TaxID=673940 RepID=A0ACB6RGP0_9PLEO|nr:uncharacterized protein BDR25DRAFT_365611 [Lindgomyces ingoldianus]KAF2478381.1 hypothetical protein BDR25DRAFT_365611 [Lindgomyces ingoldianus]